MQPVTLGSVRPCRVPCRKWAAVLTCSLALLIHAGLANSLQLDIKRLSRRENVVTRKPRSLASTTGDVTAAANSPGALSVNVTLRGPPGYAVDYPGGTGRDRRWNALFYRYATAGSTGNEEVPSFCVAGSYGNGNGTASQQAPGRYFVQIVDGRAPFPNLGHLYDFNISPGGSNLLQAAISTSRVVISAAFARVAYNTSSDPAATPYGVFIRLLPKPYDFDGYNFTDGAGAGCSDLRHADGVWDERPLDGPVGFNLLPSWEYMALFYYPSVSDIPGDVFLYNITFSTPGDEPTGSLSPTNGYLDLAVQLPQTQLCDTAGRAATTIVEERGSIPSNGTGTLVYGPGMTCVWHIVTGRPHLLLSINGSGLAPGDTVQVIYETAAGDSWTRILTQEDGAWSAFISATNVTLKFTAKTRNLKGPGPYIQWASAGAGGSRASRGLAFLAAMSWAALMATMLFL